MLEIPDHLTPTQQAVLYVAQYPCQHCLLPKLRTADQLSAFLSWRLAQHCIALCWQARLWGLDDFIFAEMKKKTISRDFYDWVHLKVSYFEALWVLCQLLAPRIAGELRELGREDATAKITALFLFKAAVMENANRPIEKSFGYVEMSGRATDKAFKTAAKAIREVLAGGQVSKEVARFTKKQGRGEKSGADRGAVCLNFLTSVAFLNFKSKAVKAQFEIFMLATANLCEKEATMARKGGSYGWNNGVKLTGSKSSVYCPAHSES
ncbi:hypothetical protein [Microcoleus sp. herbarium14]|uniref:hypothetical protein n=1 Tax=Microcoleus sp. herbarium14 TaxID=3055439 RepID=UPI002FD37E40